MGIHIHWKGPVTVIHIWWFVSECSYICFLWKYWISYLIWKNWLLTIFLISSSCCSIDWNRIKFWNFIKNFLWSNKLRTKMHVEKLTEINNKILVMNVGWCSPEPNMRTKFNGHHNFQLYFWYYFFVCHTSLNGGTCIWFH